MKRALLPVVLCVAGLVGCGPKPDAIMDQVVNNYGAVETVQEEVDCYVAPLGVNLSGTCSFQRPGKIHCDFGDPMEAKIVSDGKTMWISVPSYQTVLRMNADDEGQEVSPKHIMTFMFPEAPLAGLKEGYVAKKVSKAKLNGEKLCCLEVAPKDAESEMGKARLWVEEATGVVRKYETMDKEGRASCRVVFDSIAEVNGVSLAKDIRVEEGNGNLVGSLTVSEIKPNLPLSASFFEFKVPDGLVVLDEMPMIGIPMPDILPLE